MEHRLGGHRFFTTGVAAEPTLHDAHERGSEILCRVRRVSEWPLYGEVGEVELPRTTPGVVITGAEAGRRAARFTDF